MNYIQVESWIISIASASLNKMDNYQSGKNFRFNQVGRCQSRYCGKKMYRDDIVNRNGGTREKASAKGTYTAVKPIASLFRSEVQPIAPWHRHNWVLTTQDAAKTDIVIPLGTASINLRFRQIWELEAGDNQNESF